MIAISICIILLFPNLTYSAIPRKGKIFFFIGQLEFCCRYYGAVVRFRCNHVGVGQTYVGLVSQRLIQNQHVVVGKALGKDFSVNACKSIPDICIGIGIHGIDKTYSKSSDCSARQFCGID